MRCRERSRCGSTPFHRRLRRSATPRSYLIVVVTSGCRRYASLAQHGLPAKIGNRQVDVARIGIDRDRVRIRSDISLGEWLESGIRFAEGGDRTTFGRHEQDTARGIEGEHVRDGANLV